MDGLLTFTRMSLVSLTFFKVDFAVTLRSFIKACIWFAITVAFGLAPMLLLMLANKIAPNQELANKIFEFYNDLVIPFLCSAIIAEVGVEAFLCKVKFSKYSYLAFFLSSAMILFLVCIVYIVILNNHLKENINVSLWVSQDIIVTYTVVYCLSVKTILFKEEDKVYQKWRQ